MLVHLAAEQTAAPHPNPAPVKNGERAVTQLLHELHHRLFATFEDVLGEDQRRYDNDVIDLTALGYLFDVLDSLFADEVRAALVERGVVIG